MCETSTHPESNLGVPSPANRRHEACRAEPAPSRLLHSPAQGQVPGSGGCRQRCRAPREPRPFPRLAGPGTPRQDAAEARGSLPAGRRADLDGAQQRASCQAAPAPPAQPALPRTDTSVPVLPQAGPRAGRAGLPVHRGQGGIPIGCPPHIALGRHFPTPTNCQDCHPVLRKAKPAAEGSVPEAPDTPRPLWAPLHGQAVQKGAGTGSEQQLDQDGYRRRAKSTRARKTVPPAQGPKMSSVLQQRAH